MLPNCGELSVKTSTWYFPEPSSELNLSSEIDEDSEGMSKYLKHIYMES